MASPAIFKGRLTKFLTNGGILIPARPQTTDASAVPTPGEIAYDTENENFVVYQNGNWEVVAVFSDLIASNIVNTPYGDIEAVDVQSALNELDDDKVAREGDSLSGNLTFANNTGIESTVDESTINVGTTPFSHNVNIGTGSHTSSVNIGTGTGVTTINIGGAGDTVNIGGDLVYVQVSDLQVQDKEIIVNVGGAAGSSESAGLHVEEDGVIVGLNHVANNRQSWELKAPANEGSILVTPTLADTSTNIVASSTADRTITLPDTSDTLATQTQITNLNTRIDELTTDDVPESASPTNLYFTDARAKAAAVVNSVAGDENDQAPSVTSIVTYVNEQINALTTDDIEEGETNQYFTAERAQDAAWGAINAGTNVAGNPITATYDDDNNKIELLVNDAAIANTKLANSSVTLNGTEISLGESDFVGIYNENVSTSGTLSPNTRVMVNTSGGAITLTLPVGAEDAYIELKDAVGSWDSNNLTVAPAAGEKINGLGIDETLVCDVREGWLSFAWDVANSRWNLSTTAAINLNDIEASSISPGIVSITDQEFAGVKTFTDGILLAPNTTPVSNPTSGLQVYAKSDNKLYTLNSDGIEQAVGSGGSIILIDQVAHGFVAADVGRPVYLNGSSYEFAQADTEAKAEVAGLISRVISADQFEICLGGEVGSVGNIVDASNRTYARSFVQGSYSGFLFSRYLLDKLLQPENIVAGTATYLADGLNDILISTPGNVAPAMDNPLTEDPVENTNNNISSYVYYYNNTQYSVVQLLELWKVNFSVNGGVLTLDSFGEPGAFWPYFAFPITVPESNVSGYFVIGLYNNKRYISLTMSSDINLSDEIYYFLEYPLEGAEIASLYQSPIPQISMESGQNYFLSPTTPGALVSESPSVVGQISKPVGIARTTSALDFFNMRGSSVGGSNVYTQISLSNNATTTVQNVSAYDSVELAGWVYINATSPYRFHFKAQVTKNGAATDYLISYQTSGDTPPSGFSLSVTSAGIVQAVLPSVSGFTSAFAQFSLNGPAVGASLPLQIQSSLLTVNSGIQFPATMIPSSDVNNLDDYKEGTFSPNFYGASTAGTWTPNATATGGYYIKIGKLVYLFINLNGTLSGAAGELRIGNLPYPRASSNAGNAWNATYSAFVMAYGNGLTWAAGHYLCGWLIHPSNFMYAHTMPTGGGVAGNVNAINGALNVHIAGAYYTD